MIDRDTIDRMIAENDATLHYLDEHECGPGMEERFVMVALADLDDHFDRFNWFRVFASADPAADCLPGFGWIEIRGRTAAELRDMATAEIMEEMG